jgi:hypothetical protein
MDLQYILVFTVVSTPTAAKGLLFQYQHLKKIKIPRDNVPRSTFLVSFINIIFRLGCLNN